MERCKQITLPEQSWLETDTWEEANVCVLFLVKFKETIKLGLHILVEEKGEELSTGF